MKLGYLPLSFLILATSHSVAQPKHGHAHEHGKGRLEISVDANQAIGKLKIPLEALVGFERAPKTEAETNAINTMNQKLQNPGSYFVANKDAECSLN